MRKLQSALLNTATTAKGVQAILDNTMSPDVKEMLGKYVGSGYTKVMRVDVGGEAGHFLVRKQKSSGDDTRDDRRSAVCVRCLKLFFFDQVWSITQVYFRSINYMYLICFVHIRQ